MTHKSNLIFATREAFGITLEPTGTFNITNSFELDGDGNPVVVELPEETSIVLKNAVQLERMTITATGGVATIVTRGLTPGDTPVEDVTLRKPWGDGEVCYSTELAFNVVDLQDDNSFSGDNTFLGTDTFNNIDVSGDTITPGFASKQLTTAQRLALTPRNGVLVYDADLGENYQFIGGAWQPISAGSTQPNASETVAGKVELSTDAELLAGTSTGGTGARLVPSNDNTTTTQITNKLPVTDGTGKLVNFLNSQSDGSASETETGLVEKATDAEASAGTDDTRYMTPKQVKDNNIFPGTTTTFFSVTATEVPSGGTTYPYTALANGTYLVRLNMTGDNSGGSGDFSIKVDNADIGLWTGNSYGMTTSVGASQVSDEYYHITIGKGQTITLTVGADPDQPIINNYTIQGQ